jgi:hypothetical protein
MVLNKRGQGLSVNAIILIVLGVVVLAVLIFGFTVGFGKILPFISSGDNVETIKTACSTACSTSNTLGYCTTPREIKIDDATLGIINKDKKEADKLKSGESYSCQALLGYSGLGVQDCKSICPTPQT